MTTTRTAIFFSWMLVIAGAAFAQQGGSAGAFMTLGYGARAMGIGNAATAYTGPDALALYNPAVSAFADTREFFGSYSALGLDRTLNVLSFTAPIAVYKKLKPPSGMKDPDSIKRFQDSTKTRVSSIGISVGAIFSGVGNIDARDADGEQIGIVSTYENFYYGSFSIKFRPDLAVGAMVRFFDAKLWDKVKSSGVAVDIGALYRLNEHWDVALVVQNLAGGGYRWDTSPIYNTEGQVTEDRFPTLFRVGAAYRFDGPGGESGGGNGATHLPLTLLAELEQSTVSTTILRGGAEYAIADAFILRAGVDGYDLQHRLASQVRPSFGLTARPTFDGFTLGVHYAAIIEPVAGGLTHVLSLGFQF